jgi:hypothetical protein
MHMTAPNLTQIWDSPKNFCFPRCLSGHRKAAQTPGKSEVFCRAFFKKATACLLFAATDSYVVKELQRSAGQAAFRQKQA